jgi:hypothetical protein
VAQFPGESRVLLADYRAIKDENVYQGFDPENITATGQNSTSESELKKFGDVLTYIKEMHSSGSQQVAKIVISKNHLEKFMKMRQGNRFGIYPIKFGETSFFIFCDLDKVGSGDLKRIYAGVKARDVVCEPANVSGEGNSQGPLRLHELDLNSVLDASAIPPILVWDDVDAIEQDTGTTIKIKSALWRSLMKGGRLPRIMRRKQIDYYCGLICGGAEKLLMVFREKKTGHVCHKHPTTMREFAADYVDSDPEARRHFGEAGRFLEKLLPSLVEVSRANPEKFMSFQFKLAMILQVKLATNAEGARFMIETEEDLCPKGKIFLGVLEEKLGSK